MTVRFDSETAASLVGRMADVRLDVTDADTAIAAGSGDLPVLATPRMVALMEQAACAALADALPTGSTSVGTHVDVRHLAASPVGSTVVARATITAVSGSRVTFAVTAVGSDGATELGTGTHTRVVVERDAFLAGLG